MKKVKRNLLILIFTFLVLHGCSDDTISPVQNPGEFSNDPVNLVSDTISYSPRIIDLNLVNAWGIAITPENKFWISANHTSVSTVYDGDGNTLLSPVNIPGSGGSPGSPTGVIFNETNDFKISGVPSKFIFAGEDGIISAWLSGTSAVVAADRSSSNSVYKGIAMGVLNDSNYLYAVDFHNSKIDVFDKNFNFLPGIQLLDPGIPSGWGPFNIYNIDGKLFVSYAKQKPP